MSGWLPPRWRVRCEWTNPAAEDGRLMLSVRGGDTERALAIDWSSALETRGAWLWLAAHAWQVWRMAEARELAAEAR